MDGDRVSKSPKRNRRRGYRQKASPGLRVEPRSGCWHVTGTLRVKGRSIRIRRSTGLPATEALLEEAEAIRDDAARDIRKEIIEGVKPSATVAVAARGYLTRHRKRPLGITTVRIIQEITRRFGKRLMKNVADFEWIDFVDVRQAGNAPETRERYIGTVAGFLNWAARKPRHWCSGAPEFERDSEARNPTTRKKRRVEDLRPELLVFMIDHAVPHLAAQLAVEWSTGARVSSIFHGCRLCDLILAGDRSQITFNATKNGETVTAHLHAWTADKVAEYLEIRGSLHDREAPLFQYPFPFDGKNPRWRPYTEAGEGAKNRRSFNSMKRRASRELVVMAWEARAAGNRDDMRQHLDDARLVREFTQHWFRHLLANKLIRSADVRTAMDQGGWLKAESVLGYTRDVPEYRREKINELEIGGNGILGLSRRENKK